ncbi:MAG: CRISPR system precrRNA processing endoribonuclease RAMP protein Cas6 [bacterium]
MNKGITLRGAFGSSFRRLCCPDLKAKCSSCSLHSTCPYGFIFEPRVPEEAERLRLNRDIPRPFVIKPPLDEKEHYAIGDRFIFELILIGKVVQFFPYFLLSFQNLGEWGIGLKRGRFEILLVESLDVNGNAQVIMEAGNSMVRLPEIAIDFDKMPAPPEKKVAITFLTPILLKHGGRWVLPNFGTLIRRLRDRLNALSYFYCQEVLSLDFYSLGKKADKIISEFGEMSWIEEDRYSKYKNLTHTLKGWIGQAEYKGDISEFWPFLWIGQYIHVGKAATFGQGWYKVKPA